MLQTRLVYKNTVSSVNQCGQTSHCHKHFFFAEVNPDAPHIHAPNVNKTFPENLSDVSLLQVSADDMDESIMKDINEANLQGVMNVEGAEKVFKIVKSSFFYFYPSCIFS